MARHRNALIKLVSENSSRRRQVYELLWPRSVMDIAAYIVNSHLRIKVRPGARKTEILDREGVILHMAVAAPPEDGKAIAEVERFLTKLTGRKATIKSGFSSKEKLVHLTAGR
jgi:uncharacterized protein YggU (UPF0235/DUF167 family)